MREKVGLVETEAVNVEATQAGGKDCGEKEGI